MRLRIGGATYREIGEALGASRHGAHELVKKELQRLRRDALEAADDLRAIEVARLESLHLALWPQRTSPRVADTIIRLAERRARLLGLDANPELIIGGIATRGVLMWDFALAEEVGITQEGIHVPGNGGGRVTADKLTA